MSVGFAHLNVIWGGPDRWRYRCRAIVSSNRAHSSLENFPPKRVTSVCDNAVKFRWGVQLINKVKSLAKKSMLDYSIWHRGRNKKKIIKIVPSPRMNLALFLLFCTAGFSLGFGFRPEVFQLDSNKFHDVHYFEGSGRLLDLSEENLVYSQDHGTTRKESREIDSQTPIETIMKDQFLTNRAFVTGPNVSYVTKDYGKNWQKRDIPSSNVSNFCLPFFKTYPSNRNYIIAVKTAC